MATTTTVTKTSLEAALQSMKTYAAINTSVLEKLKSTIENINVNTVNSADVVFDITDYTNRVQAVYNGLTANNNGNGSDSNQG